MSVDRKKSRGFFMRLDVENIIGKVEVYSAGRRSNSAFPFVLIRTTDKFMRAVSERHCIIIRLPENIVLPRQSEVAFRDVTGYEYAPSTQEHWGFLVGNRRVHMLELNKIL